MKNIVFATTGSLGDLYPFLSVGQELSRRGYAVHIATTQKHRAHVERANLSFAPMRPDPWNTPDFGKRFMDRKKGAEFVFRSYLSPAIEQSYEDLMHAVKDADMLVSQSLALAAPIVAEKTGMPWLSAVFQPLTLFSSWEPPRIPGLPFVHFRHAWAAQINRHILEAAKRWTEQWVAPVYALREAHGLTRGPHPIYEGQHSPTAVLAMFPRILGESQPDWPPQIQQTGCATYTLPAPLSDQLREFLQSGSPPILFTLGASSSLDPNRFFEESLNAAHRIGRRALLVTGRDDIRLDVPPDAFCVSYVPYMHVLPHVCAIVHSGGIGTICLAIAAGKPQLLVPFAHDQADNAQRAVRTGVALQLARQRYRAPFVSQALEKVLTLPVAALEHASGKIGEENGACYAADTIEEKLRD